MTKPITVSDHALVRWMERVNKIELQEFRDAIASVVETAMDAGATSICVGGFTYTINPKTRTVITVLAPEMRQKRSRSFLANTTSGEPRRL
jgi:hypothetical protein